MSEINNINNINTDCKKCPSCQSRNKTMAKYMKKVYANNEDVKKKQIEKSAIKYHANMCLLFLEKDINNTVDMYIEKKQPKSKIDLNFLKNYF